MRKLFVLAIVSISTLFAQFSSMATDYDGRRLLFTTNLSQTGSAQPGYGKLFVADWRGVQPLLIYNYVVLNTTGLYPGQPGLISNFFYVDGVDVSSNGAYISVMAGRQCVGYTSLLCGYADQSTLYGTHGQAALTSPGHVIVSQNGKWALAVLDAMYGGLSFSLFDMTTGAAYPLSGAPGFGAAHSDWRYHGVADDGTVVISGYGTMFIFRPPDSIQQIALSGNSTGGLAAIDASASIIVWEQVDGAGNSTLHSVRPFGLETPTSLTPAGQVDSAPRISDDGSKLLFLSKPTVSSDSPQAFLMAIDGKGRRPVTAEKDGIAKAVLSGNGRVVWALTRTGRLLQIEIDSGARTQYTEPMAAFLAPYYFENDPLDRSVSGEFSSPGQVISVPASVMPGEKVEITVQSQRAPVISVAPGIVTFQIPQTTLPNPGKNSATVVIRKPDSLSWSGDNLNVTLPPSPPTLLASVHQDFSALITTGHPAQAGEVVHLYGTGFGSVTPPVPDGVAAPLTPLSRTALPVTCDLLNIAGTNIGPGNVLFAGLAPGMTGIYQLDVRLPDSLPTPEALLGNFIQIACRAGENESRIEIPVL